MIGFVIFEIIAKRSDFQKIVQCLLVIYQEKS